MLILDTGFSHSLPTHLTSNIRHITFVLKQLKHQSWQSFIHTKNFITLELIFTLYRTIAKAFTKWEWASVCHKKGTKPQMRQDAIIDSRCEDMRKIKSFHLLSTSYMVTAAVMKHWSHSSLFWPFISSSWSTLEFLWVKFHSYSFKLMEQELAVSLCRSQPSVAHLRPALAFFIFKCFSSLLPTWSFCSSVFSAL